MDFGNWKLVTAMVCALSFPAAMAGGVEYTWSGAGAETDGNYDSPFENPANYTGNSGCPGTDDVIAIPANTDLAITSRVQLYWLARLARIKPVADTSRLVVTVPQGETWTNFCPVSGVDLSSPGGYVFENGVIVKRGDGALHLEANGKLAVGSTYYDYWTGIKVEKGDLLLPQGVTNGSRYYGYVTVDEGARLFTVRRLTNSSSTYTTYVRGLFGGGTVTNSDNTTGTSYQLQLMPLTRRTGEFSGVIGGANMSLCVYNSGGTAKLTGTNSTYTGATVLMGSTLAVESIGKSGKPSSLGSGNRINFNPNSASRLVYAGKGETTDRDICLYQNTTSPAYIDGGEFGGLVLTGSLLVDGTLDKTRTLVFAGDNANECVLNGIMYGRYWNSTHTIFYDQPYYAKEGSGTWRATHHTGRAYPNGWAIREGTLKYDSLDEKRFICSLGTATNLTSGTANDQVSYAFCLGSTKDSAPEAVFAYSGLNEYSVSTRPITLIGDATFRNDSVKAIRFAGADARISGLKMLTLAGDGGASQTNEFADISDGVGQIGVAKTGSATWVLGGDQTFTGPIDVQEGTLIVRKIDDPKYTWFRLTLMEQHVKTNEEGAVTATAHPHINSFALLDANGAWQNENMGYMENSIASLPPGQSTWQNAWGVNCANQSDTIATSPEKMFVKATNYGAFIYPVFGTGTQRPVPESPITWARLVMRLKTGANEIASHDIMNVWGDGTRHRCVKSYTLEGSVDGLHWEKVVETNNLPVASASWTWSYRNTTGNPNPHTGGAALYRGSTLLTWHVLEGGNTVSVAPVAKIVADGDITLSSVKLSANGGGTIEGFSFAGSGTLDITDWAGSYDEIPLRFANATDFANVSGWSLKLDGENSSRKFVMTENGVRIKPRGTMFSIR